MGQDSKIEWTHHTFNPWIGCTKVSAGCANCYAEAMMDTRYGKVKWGDNGTRVVKKDWSEPRKWNRWAAEGICWTCGGKGYIVNKSCRITCDTCFPNGGRFRAPYRARVFCASLADVFEDRPELVEPRERLFKLIDETPHLDWLLLTKRPENIERLTPWRASGSEVSSAFNAWQFPFNVWLGTSIENQATADERIPHLLRVPAVVRFLSCEPLLGPIRLPRRDDDGEDIEDDDERSDWGLPAKTISTINAPPGHAINWVIIGGESGTGARPCDIAWVRSLVTQCNEADVPAFVKQLGAKPFSNADKISHRGASIKTLMPERRTTPVFFRFLNDRKGGDINEWPKNLRVREMPTGGAVPA